MNPKFDMPFVPKSLRDLLTEISMTRDFSMKYSKLDYHIHFLEIEFTKIEAFQHELPHTMQIMKEGIDLLKKERSRLRKIEDRRAFGTGEFMPVPSEARERGESSQNNHGNKKDNWMNQVPRLWNTTIQFHNGGNEALTFKSRGNNVGPLKRAYSDMEQVKGKGIAVEEISMQVPVEPIDMTSDPEFKHPKKPRRCWSPDLHKRFVDALDELGGPSEATPRQIRDKMNVEGLTNDEVKSHLQKYRLHIRKLAAGQPPEENLEEGGAAANDGGAAADEADKTVNQD